MDFDGKIFRKKKTWNPFHKHIKKIIHHYQAGFITEMQEQFNIRKSVNVISHINKLKEKMIMQFDAEQSFVKL